MGWRALDQRGRDGGG